MRSERSAYTINSTRPVVARPIVTKRPGASVSFNQPAYSLSYANRRRLEIARAMATNPRLLLLDEQASGMNPKETQEMTELIQKLRTERGYSILLIEHDMNVVGAISDRVIALDYGQKVAEGKYEDVVTDERVIEAYLGRTQQARTK